MLLQVSNDKTMKTNHIRSADMSYMIRWFLSFLFYGRELKRQKLNLVIWLSCSNGSGDLFIFYPVHPVNPVKAFFLLRHALCPMRHAMVSALCNRGGLNHEH
jgi:hypothetical protein